MLLLQFPDLLGVHIQPQMCVQTSLLYIHVLQKIIIQNYVHTNLFYDVFLLH